MTIKILHTRSGLYFAGRTDTCWRAYQNDLRDKQICTFRVGELEGIKGVYITDVKTKTGTTFVPAENITQIQVEQDEPVKGNLKKVA